MLGDQVEVERAVVGEQDDGVGRGDLLLVEFGADDPRVDGGALHDVRVDGPHLGTQPQQPVDDADGGRLAGVAGVGLVGQAEHQHPGAGQGTAALVERGQQPLHDVGGHVVVDVVGELDEPEAAAEGPVDPPGQVDRVDGQAVATDAGAGGEAHEAERLGGGGVHRFPDIDAQLPCVDGEFVDQGDVDVPEGVLDQLGQLRHLGRLHRHGRLDDRAVEGVDSGEGGLVHTGDDLGGGLQGPHPVARVDPLRAVAQVEVGARGEPGVLLQDRGDQFLGGPGIGGGLQDHRGTLAQEPAQDAGGRLDGPKVGDALAQRRRDTDDGHVEAADRALLGGGQIAPAGQCGKEPLRRDVLDEGLARGKPLDAVLVDVETDDRGVLVGLHGAYRERQADVPLAHDDDLWHRPVRF